MEAFGDLVGLLISAVCLLGPVAIVIWIVVAIVKKTKRSRIRRINRRWARSGSAGRGNADDCSNCSGRGRISRSRTTPGGRIVYEDQTCGICQGTGGASGRGMGRMELPGHTGSAAIAVRPTLTASPAGGPQPHERWWADFPHQDDPTASKARPCLIVGYSGKGYWVLKCTTQAPKQAEWRIPVNAAWWVPASDKDGYIDLVPFHLPEGFLKRKLGVLNSTKLITEVEGRIRWERAWDFIG